VGPARLIEVNMIVHYARHEHFSAEIHNLGGAHLRHTLDYLGDLLPVDQHAAMEFSRLGDDASIFQI